MKNFKVLIGSSIVLWIVVVGLSAKIVTQLNHYKHNKEEIAEVLNFENRLLDAGEYMGDILSIFDTGTEKISDWDKLRKKAEIQYSQALKLGFLLLVSVLIYMLINYFTYQSTPNKNQVLGIVFVSSALSFLFLGLQTPFIEVEAFNIDLTLTSGVFDALSKTFDGRTYYLYQNKSVFQLITLLFEGGNFLVGLCLVFFSIVFPLIKLLASLLILIKPKTSIAQKSVRIINKLGKWSMADVFIAAVFLAVFSFANMNVGVDTASKTLIGSYFFLAFVVLSIVSGVFLKDVVSNTLSNKG